MSEPLSAIFTNREEPQIWASLAGVSEVVARRLN